MLASEQRTPFEGSAKMCGRLVHVVSYPYRAVRWSVGYLLVAQHTPVAHGGGRVSPALTT